MADDNGWTVIHFAARNGISKLIKKFGDIRRDVHIKTKDGKNCLHIAALNGHFNLCKTLIDNHSFDVHTPDNDGFTALHLSARNGSYELVKYFADTGIDIHLKTNNGENCLHIAALNGHFNLCKKLISTYNFDVHTPDNDGFTALHHSASNGSYELVNYFADIGSDIYLKANHGENCLHIAALNGHFNLCSALIDEHNFDVHKADNDGWVALHFSVRNGSYELVHYFADMGIDIHVKTKDGWNCLHIAALNAHLNLCKTLIDKHNFDVHMADNDGWLALHFSAKKGSYELFKYFADMGSDIHLKAKDGRNCLHIAALNAHLNLCKTLIDKHNFDVHMADNDGWIAPHFSSTNDNYDLFKYFIDMECDILLETNDGWSCLHIAALYGNLNLCKTLLGKHNFNVHMADSNGWTPLHHSARNGNYELVTYFSGMENDINFKTNNGQNCLHIAARYGHLNLCKLLINKHNFDMHMTDKMGWIAAHFSAENGNYELINYFGDIGTDIHLKTNQGWNCLHIAALNRHLNLCKTLIDKHNFDVHMADNDGWTPLHHSSRKGSNELVNYFADMGRDILLKTNYGMNCLHIAALYGHLNLCKSLTDKFNFDVPMGDNDGWAALHFSARNGSFQLVKYFADMGSDVHLKTNDGVNCLHIAAHYGHLNLCKALIDNYNFDVHVADNDGWTALHHSSRNSSYELVTYFAGMENNISLKTDNGQSCLHIAALNGHLDLCNKFIEKHSFDIHMTDKDGWSPLHFSAGSGGYELVNFFAVKGSDIYLKTNDGENCLHIAALYGHLNLCKTLIDWHNFNINMTDNDGWIAVHFSARNGSYELIKYFSYIGCDIHLKTNEGRNCLHIAALSGHLNLCKTLTEKHNFEVHMADSGGWTALHFSARNGSYDLVKYFVDMRADIHLKTNNRWNCLHIAALYRHSSLSKTLIDKHNFSVNMADNDGWVALHFAARSGSYELVKYFVNKGSDIHLKTNDEENCLHISALYGHLNLCKTLLDKHNFDVHATDKDGWIALHHSARNGSYELVTYFAIMEPDINLKTNDGKNCLHIAALNGHLSLCKVLVENYNFDVNMADNDGWIALHFSSANNSYELVNYFTNIGSDIQRKTNDGENCLHIAALNGHLNLCKKLINKHNLDLDMANNDGWAALHFSAANNSYKLVSSFAEMGSDIHLKTNNGENCLHIAALHGHLSLCKVLIDKHNFDVRMADYDGWEALHFSVRNGSYELFTYLADIGSDILVKTNDRVNCLHIAALHGHLSLCKTLIAKYNFDVRMTDNEGWTALHFSIRNGSYELVKFFADIGSDIYLKTKDGKNCLHIAALYGHLNLCKTLIDKHNFDVHMADYDGWEALHFSVRNGSYELFTYLACIECDIYVKTNDRVSCLHIAALHGHLSLCKTLIAKYNFDVRMTDNEGWTALHFSIRNGSYELVKFFADMGSDIYLKTKDGKNCLHIAALYGHLNLCKTLIDKHNFDVHMADYDGWEALHFSVRNGSYELFTYLACIGCDIYVKTNDRVSCLHIAALHGHLSLCKTLIAKYNFDVRMTDNEGWTALHFSIRNGSYELVKFFADMGSDIYLKTKDGKNCLHIAALYGHLNLCKTLIDKHNFDVHMADYDGWEALHFSVRNGSYELFTYLACIGCDIYVKTNDRVSCLHIAALHGHLSLCKTLIAKYNFDVRMTDNEGWTALHFSIRNGSYELVKFFADMGSDIYLKTKDGKNCLHIAALYGHLNLCKTLIYKHNFDVHMADYDGWEALHFSVRNGSYELFTHLACLGCDIYVKTNDRVSCLHIAALHGHLSLCKALIAKYNFDVRMTDNEGWTALHFSIRNGSYELVKFFADMGSDIYLKTKDGKNCLHIAALYGHLNLCKTLIDKHNFDVHVADNDGWLALHFSARNGSYELVTYFADMAIDTNLKTNDRDLWHPIEAFYRSLNFSKAFKYRPTFDVCMAHNDRWKAHPFFKKTDSFESVKDLAGARSNIYLKTNDGRNCLHIAALYGHLNLCKTLNSKHNFDVDMADNDGWTALHFSARNGSYELIRYFADVGSDIYLKTNDGKNCLHIAAFYGHLNLCRTLKEKHNFDLQRAVDNYGQTALHFSVRNGNFELVRYFVDMKTDINLKTKYGINCLHIAASNGHLNLCKLLINKHYFDAHMADNDGFTALHYSARNGSYELVTYFAGMEPDINLKTNDGENCLHIAALNGHLNLCKTLIDKRKFDKNVADNEGWRALHFSAKNGSYKLVKYFADMGTDINLKTKDGKNCLHIAALYGHLNLCKKLLDYHNFDVHLMDNDQCTALHYSAESGSFDLFLLIVGKGSEIYGKTKSMRNVLHLSALNGHFKICKFVLEYFIKDYRDENTRNQYTLSGRSYRSQIFYKYSTIFLHATDIDGNTYLHLAAEGNQAKICNLLLTYDTEVLTLLNKNDKTARDIARDNGYKAVLNVLKPEYDRAGMFLLYF